MYLLDPHAWHLSIFHYVLFSFILCSVITTVGSFLHFLHWILYAHPILLDLLYFFIPLSHHLCWSCERFFIPSLYFPLSSFTLMHFSPHMMRLPSNVLMMSSPHHNISQLFHNFLQLLFHFQVIDRKKRKDYSLLSAPGSHQISTTADLIIISKRIHLVKVTAVGKTSPPAARHSLLSLWMDEKVNRTD